MSQRDLFELSPKAAAVLPAEAVRAKTPFSFLEQTRFSMRLDQALAGSMAFIVGLAIVYGAGVECGRRLERQGRPLKTAVQAPAAQPQPGEVQTQAKNSQEIRVPTDIRLEAGDSEAIVSTHVSSSLTTSSLTLVSQSETRISGRPKGTYTIQMATYKAQSMAQKKVAALAGQGLKGFWVTSGSYYLVCINGFEQRQQASQSLIQLKSRGIVPQDAYVRMSPA